MKNLFLSPEKLNIAHRGARSLAPENTLAAARKGLAIGADGWELDVQVTSDEVLVIMHDPILTRTTNVAQVFPERAQDRLHTFTFAELRRLDAGSHFNATDPFQQIAAGAVTAAEQKSYAGELIPTLEEALLFTRENHWKVNIEIKDATGTPGDAFVVERVVEMVRSLGMVERVLISSFNQGYLPRVRAAAEQALTAVITNDPGTSDPIALVRSLGANGINPGPDVIGLVSVPEIRRAGFEVHAWTINEIEDMRRLAKTEVSAIVSDFPQRVKEVL